MTNHRFQSIDNEQVDVNCLSNHSKKGVETVQNLLLCYYQ